MARKLTCPVCGRKFPEGQGVALDFKGAIEVFHSKACALKFIRHLIDKVEAQALSRAYRETLDEFKELLRRRMEASKKRI